MRGGLPCEPEKEVLARKAGVAAAHYLERSTYSEESAQSWDKGYEPVVERCGLGASYLGEGSETRRWKQLAERLGVASRCFFLVGNRVSRQWK
jgi:hypothetical protein